MGMDKRTSNAFISRNKSLKKAKTFSNVDSTDFITKNNKRYYKAVCANCGADKGYRSLKDLKDHSKCNKCTNSGKYSRTPEQYKHLIEYSKSVKGHIGKPHTEITKKILSEKQSNYCKKYGNQFNTGVSKGKHTPESIAKISKNNSGKAPRWKGRVFEYKGLKLRSSWELKFVQYLDSLGVKWEYEPQFILSNGKTFSPDFKLEDGTIIEIKGYMTPKGKEKWELFELDYPEIKKEILYEDDLLSLGLEL